MTPFKTCTGSTSLNFYIAGMRASTTYSIQQDVFNGPFNQVGPIVNFTTAGLPNDVVLPPFAQPTPATGANSLAYNVVLTGGVNNAGSMHFIATDTQGRLIWYVPVDNYITRPVRGGTFLGPFSGSDGPRRMLREIDLAGNLIRETNVTTVNQQIEAMGGTDLITEFHHEAVRLPNGDTAVLGSMEMDRGSGSGPRDVVADMVVVLDSNFQVKWFWNEFDHLDIRRPAVVTRRGIGYGVAPLCGIPVSQSRTIGRTRTPSPTDRRGIDSFRASSGPGHQIDYRDGAGNGNILSGKTGQRRKFHRELE